MNIRGLTRKEFGRVKADKRTLALLFFVPFILIVIFGFTTGGGPTEFFNAAVITRDDLPSFGDFPSNHSDYDDIFISVMRDNCSAFGLYDSFNGSTEEKYNSSFYYCIELLRNEEIDVFIILPENFSETVDNETNPHLIYYIDGSDMQAVSAINVSIQEPISLFRMQAEFTENFTIMVPYLEFDVPFWESQMLNYALPIMIPLIICGTCMNLTTLSIVSEGPLPRMLLTPTAKFEIIISKLLANAVIMMLQSTEVFIMTALFGLYSLGSLFDLYLLLLATGFCGVTIGLFISSISPTEQVANQMYIIFFIVILLFSGAFIEPETLGSEFKIIINALPLAHAIPILLDIVTRGLSINLEHFISLNIISLVFIIMAYIAYSFKKVEV
jgi:ABC-2 type transport system permease protein